MFILAIAIGIYSYLIFFFGLLGLLTTENVMLVTIGWLVILLIVARGNISLFIRQIRTTKIAIKSIFAHKLLSLLIVLIVLQALINLIGAFAPELAFDALWYHLTLPKLYLLQHAISHVLGGLLYYSDMPKLGEMLYTGAMALSNEITAKVVHFVFGLLTCVIIYKISRKFLSPLLSIIAAVIFYSNLVVAWESTTAYIDLIRTFFETMSLWGLINWYETGKKKWLMLSAVLIGLAITTKLLALGTLVIFSLGVIWISLQKKKKVTRLLLDLALYMGVALLIPLPWFLFSFIHTGNPLYPLFSPLFTGVHDKVFTLALLEPLHIVFTFWNTFTHASDPISPLYLIFMPLLIVSYKRMAQIHKVLFVYLLLGLLFWYLTSQVEGTRMLMPYLPVYSLLIAYVINQYKTNIVAFKFFSLLIIIIACISLLYRCAATVKYVPVVFGMESKRQFLTNHLNFSFGDFYDTDNYFANHIAKKDRVLLYGFHNLYYVDFPFIDSSWLKEGDVFNYVAVQNSHLPSRFRNWQLSYKNDKTLVQLYKPPKGACSKLCVY